MYQHLLSMWRRGLAANRNDGLAQRISVAYLGGGWRRSAAHAHGCPAFSVAAYHRISRGVCQHLYSSIQWQRRMYGAVSIMAAINVGVASSRNVWQCMAVIQIARCR